MKLLVNLLSVKNENAGIENEIPKILHLVR